MTKRNEAITKDNERSEIDALPEMATVAQVAKAGNCSRGLIYKILKEPDGPAYVKLGKKTLIDKREWLDYLRRKTVQREAVVEESDAA